MWHYIREAYLLALLIIWRLGIPWMRAAHIIPNFVDEHMGNPDQPLNWPKRQISVLIGLVGVLSVCSVRRKSWLKKLAT